MGPWEHIGSRVLEGTEENSENTHAVEFVTLAASFQVILD